MASYYQQYSPTPYNNEKHGYGSWYQNCTCCPYGYHIDLDFVQFCDSIIQQADRTGSIKRRRDRRRQRQSMEVLLGLEPYPATANFDKENEKIIEEETSKLVPKPVNHTSLPDDLEEAVSDFERTLKRSKKLANKNLPDVTAVHETIRRAPSISSMSSTSGSSMTVLPPSVTDGIVCKDFDTVSIESCGLSPMALQNIREQMALSLERTKELEERVKLIPLLKTQLSTLEKEKQHLILQLKDYESAKLNAINGNYINNSEKAGQVQNDSHANFKKETFTTRKDFGVMCSVLTRNVGVGHQCPNTKSVSTTTTNGELKEGYTDKWYNEKLKFLDNTPQSFHTPRKPILISKDTQTPLPITKIHSSSQTIEKPIIRSSNATQTLPNKTSVCNIGIEAKVFALEASSQTTIKCNTVGVSDDKIDDIPCSKCNSKFESHQNSVLNSQKNSISLASLAVSRSKSFNLGDDKLNLTQQKKRTVGCQYDCFSSHKAVQSECRTQTKACQKDLKITHKGVQYESFTLSKNTDTKDLDLGKKHVACNTKNTKIELAEIACNTEDITSTCVKCSKKEDSKKDENAPPSRIPRLQIPTTPVENRKFRRQDTYTKIPASPDEASGLSGLDLSGKHDTELPSSFEKVKQNYNLPEVSTSPNENASKSDQDEQQEEAALPLAETEFAQSCRKKVKPSKEMQAALKVLNDSLQKGQIKNIKNRLKSAINIIQQEWFKISSLANANPLDVEDYLDCFEDISCDLLQYVVNMVDSNGNTAMHYAVSHGNFDVVSILLDSKVCDINQTNNAGYTSVMLVSLAVCFSAHANVVRRLFQLADVNIRAKQHGQTALMLTVSHGRVDMVQMLIEAGADINIQDDDGSTALMCASVHGHIDIVKYLLSLPDCDSTILDVDGSTALKIAMEAGHRHIGVLLYAHERNIHGAVGPKLKRTKSASGSPKAPSSPLPLRSSHRALSDNRSNK